MRQIALRFSYLFSVQKWTVKLLYTKILEHICSFLLSKTVAICTWDPMEEHMLFYSSTCSSCDVLEYEIFLTKFTLYRRNM